MINIHLKFFGAFREYGESIDFTIPMGSNLKTIKKIITEKVPNSELIKSSVIANDDEILTETDILDKDCNLSILPPVCGG